MVRKKKDNTDTTQKEYEERLLEIRRVTRVTTGGRRMSFRATVLLWNRKGKIGIGTAKGPDVSIAVRKAAHEAYKAIIVVPVTEGNTIPYAIAIKHKASKIKLIPAAAGTWLKAWSSLRAVLELAGYENILSKIVGSNNKLNVALTTFKALAQYKHTASFAKKHEEVTEEIKEDQEEIATTEKKSSPKTLAPEEGETPTTKAVAKTTAPKIPAKSTSKTTGKPSMSKKETKVTEKKTPTKKPTAKKK